MTIKDFHQLVRDLEAKGYKPYIHKEDVEIAAETPCGTCGKSGANGEGYRKVRDGFVYRVFSVCPHCGQVVEF